MLTSTLITAKPHLSPVLLSSFTTWCGGWGWRGEAHHTNYNVEISIMVSIYINIQYILHHAKLVHQSYEDEIQYTTGFNVVQPLSFSKI